MQISISELRQTAYQLLQQLGHTEADASIIVEILLYSDLRGKDQGVIKLLGDSFRRSEQQQEFELIVDLASMALLDGGQRNAMVAMQFAADIAIGKANESGVAVVGVNNTSTSSGCLGYYAERIAKRGLLALIMAASPTPCVAPYGSREALLGTNPLAFAAPGNNSNIVLDIATASISLFGVRQAHAEGLSIPEGSALDVEGRMTTDPQQALAGVLTAFGGHKGAGISVMIEVLAGCLVGAGHPGSLTERSTNSGHFILALKPDLFADTNNFSQRLDRMSAAMRDALPLRDGEPVRAPGSGSEDRYRRAIERGHVDIPQSIWARLQQKVES